MSISLHHAVGGVAAAHQAAPAKVETSSVVLDVHAVGVAHLPVEELGDVDQL